MQPMRVPAQGAVQSILLLADVAPHNEEVSTRNRSLDQFFGVIIFILTSVGFSYPIKHESHLMLFQIVLTPTNHNKQKPPNHHEETSYDLFHSLL